MRHRVFVHAPDGATMSASAKNVGALGCEYFTFGSRVVGYIEISSVTLRGVLRQDSTIMILPGRNSPADASAHGNALGVKGAKTARDIFQAIFAATNADLFDPDL